MFVDPAPEPWRSMLLERWRLARDEALALPDAQWTAYAPPQHNYAHRASFVPLALRYVFPWFHGDMAANRAACPATARLLDDLPGVFTLAFSRMLPGARVAPHRDLEEPGFLRFHVGLSTDGTARFRCGDTWISWREGEVHAFHPQTEHEVVHDGASPRIVLLLDVDAATLARLSTVRTAT
jgi:aspartyl/asparaginyl beta-hydroxylase (cupin superfamily)